jgi:hypothetical protein
MLSPLPVARALPFAAVVFALAMIVSYGSLLGYLFPAR